ncbi:hypothetical protein Q8814_24750, partial [Rhodococcus sp. CC-R104]|nr:hypothetical protein [Rhodococcus sp. CC-R104]
MTLVAGIDSSTQSCKVMVCDADTGRVVREGRAAHPAGTEVDPRALATVIAASGTTPTASTHAAGPPSSRTRSDAASAERMSFHSSASRTTEPASSRHTM